MEKENLNVYEMAHKFKKNHHGGIAWRIDKHCRVIEEHLNPGEKIIYVFCGQKNDKWYDIFMSCVVALTNKRILIAQDRVVWGYFLTSITPDLYNDLFVYRGLLFGKIIIDTVKEEVTITNLPKSALTEIETYISELMMNQKRKYGINRTTK